jgi:hypothetical protein
MDQGSICSFLAVKSFKGREVHIELETAIHEKAVGYSTVTKYLRSTSFDQREPIQRDEEDSSDLNIADQAILQALAFQPFGSVHKISRMILLSKSMVYRHLIQSLALGEPGPSREVRRFQSKFHFF